jgi:hypothetical protein
VSQDRCRKALDSAWVRPMWDSLAESPAVIFLALGLDKVTNNPNNVTVLLNRIFHRSKARRAYLCATKTKTKYHWLQ